MFRRHWNDIFFAPEDGGGDGGEGDGGGDDSGGGAGTGGGDAGGGQQDAKSLRAQLAASLDEADRPAFLKWAESHTDDKSWAKSAVHMRTSFDNRVPIPKPDDKPEKINEFWEKVGKPKEPKEYAFDWGKTEDGKPRELDDEEAGFFEGFKEHSFKVHKTKAQFEEDLKFYNDFQAKQEAAFQAKIGRAQKEAEARLKQDWGPDFDDNLAFAEEAGAAFADNPDEWAAFVNTPMTNGMRVGDHPTMLRMMAKIGRANAEDMRVRNLHQSGEAEDIKAKIAELEQAAMDAGESTSSEKWHKKLQPLYEKLYPKKHSGAGTGMGFGGN